MPDNKPFRIDRKVWVAQIAMITTFVIAFLASQRGIDIPAEVQVAITGLLVAAIGGVAAWLTSASRADITSKMDNSLVIEAQNDPRSPVDLAKIESSGPGSAQEIA